MKSIEVLTASEGSEVFLAVDTEWKYDLLRKCFLSPSFREISLHE